MKRLILTLIIIFCFAVSADATLFYLNSAAGDGGNGLTTGTAWNELSDIAGVGAGDTVYLTGALNEQFLITTDIDGPNYVACDGSWVPTVGGFVLTGVDASGLGNNNQAIAFYGALDTTLTGWSIVTDADTDVATALFLISSTADSTFTMDSCIIDMSTIGAAADIPSVFIVYNDSDVNLVIRNCTVNNVQANYYFVRGYGDGDISIIDSNIFLKNGGISLNKFIRFEDDAGHGGGALTVSGSIISTCGEDLAGGALFDIDQNGVAAGRSISFTNNVLGVTNAAWVGYVVDAENSSDNALASFTFDNNTVYDYGNGAATNVGGVIYLNSTSQMTSPPTIRNNYIECYQEYPILIGTNAYAAYSDNNHPNAVVSGNKILGIISNTPDSASTQHAIIIGQSPGGLVENNYVEGTAYGTVLKNHSSGTVDFNYSGGVKNNVYVNCSIYGIYLKGPQNVEVWGNTLFNDSAYGLNTNTAGIQLGSDDAGYSITTGNSIKNNIVYGIDGQRLLSSISDATGSILSNNLYYNGSSTDTADFTFEGTEYSSFALYNAAAAESNSAFGDPLFISTTTEVGKNIMCLRRSSPARDAGLDLGVDGLNFQSVFPDYIYTTAINGDARDIGAYEFIE